MKVSKAFHFVFVAILIFCAVTKAKEEADSDSRPSGKVASEETDGIVEENPNYVSPDEESSHYHEEEEEDDNVDEDDEEPEKERAKTAIGKALSKHHLTPREGLEFVKKHRVKITIALALFAFRREIKQLLLNSFSRPYKDPETGEIVRLPLRISPTSILKILLFIDMMWRMQSSGGGKAAPLVLLFLAGGRRNPVLSMILSKMLAPSNPAFIPPIEQHFTFERVNERYKKDGMALQKAMYPRGSPDPGMSSASNSTSLTQLLTGRKPAELTSYNETVILVDMTGLDSSLSQIEVIRDEVSFLLSEYRAKALPTKPNSTNMEATSNATEPETGFEVVVLLESPGGSAADYALAAQQILRLRNEPGITVTVIVDKVAASGGYMIACTSSPGRLFAAPFAVLGSIGVIGQTLNVHKTLEGWGVQPLVFRGGKDKAPVGLIGEVTNEGIAKVQDMIDDTHRAFKQHVVDARPVISEKIEELASGTIWLGYDAIEIGLVDRLTTSDEYIGERLSEGARVLKLVKLNPRKYLFQRPTTSSSLTRTAQSLVSRSLLTILSNAQALLEKLVLSLNDIGLNAEHEQPVVARMATANQVRTSSSLQ